MKIKSTFLIIIFAFIAFAQISNAQYEKPLSPEKMEKMRAQRIAFLTDFLDLSIDEAQKFWPIYNQQQKATELLRKKKVELHIKLHEKSGDMSDQELETISDQMITFEKEFIDIKLEFHEKYKQTLPIKKLIKFYQAEDKFKLELLKQIRDKKTRQRRG